MNPVKLELKNIFSHEDSTVDFSQLTNVVLIVGENKDTGASNGCGKSSLFRGMTWCLFGECGDNLTLSDVVRNGDTKTIATAIFEFEYQGKHYKVMRKTTTEATKDLSLSVKEGSSWRSLTGKHKVDTQNLILEIVGAPYEVFCNSVYFQQGYLDNFCQLTATGRKRIFEEMQGLGIWDRVRDLAKVEHDVIETNLFSLNGSLQELRAKIQSTTREQLLKDIQDCQKRIDIRQVEKKELEDKVKEINTVRSSLGAVVELERQLNYSKKDLVTITSRVSSLKEDCVDAMNRGNKRKEDIVASELYVKSLRENCAKAEEEKRILATNRVSKETLKEIAIVGKEEQQKLIAIYNYEIQEAKNKLSLLASVKGSSCYVCDSELSPEKRTQLVYSAESVIKDRTTAINVSSEIVRAAGNSYTKSVQEINLIDNRVRELELLPIELSREEDSLKSLQEMLEEDRKNLNTLRERGKAEQQQQVLLQARVQELEQKLAVQDNSVKLSEIDEELNSLDNGLLSLNSVLSGEADVLSRVKMLLEQYIATEERVRGYEKTLASTKAEMSVYTELMIIFGSNGIPFELMKKALKDLEVVTNNVLTELTDGGQIVKFSTFRMNRAGEISTTNELGIDVYDGKRWRKVNTFSGGEQAIISIAIRVGLSKILMMYNKAHFNILFIDEGLGSLDEIHKDKIIALVKHLSREHKVLVITHMQDLQTRFENILKVEMSRGVSKVVQS